MRFDKFGVTAIIIGAVLLAALKLLYYDQIGGWSAMFLGILLGAISSFAIIMVIIGLLLLIL
jgi:hypothetical protein